jgi:ABC-type transport system substrate-binding protein
MNQTIRRIAVSGSAAVALLGGAAAITTASAPSASAAEMQTVINRATGAPVNMPDGRVVHVRGMDAAAYKASPEQHSVIVQAAAKTDTTDPAGITTGLTADGGQGAVIQNPVTGQQAGYNQQITTQSAGGTIAVGVVAIAILGLIVFFRVRHNHLKVGDAVVVTLLGVALSGTVIGAMATQMTNSGVGSLGGILGGLG